MQTNAVMESLDREFLGYIVRQRTKDSFFCLKDLEKVGNEQRLKEGLKPVSVHLYFQIDSHKEFLAQVEAEIGGKAYISGRGRNSQSWVHPYIFIDIALWYSPKIKLNVYKWLVDYLIKNRINSCDSFKKMCGCLYDHAERKMDFHKDIKNLSIQIKKRIGVDDWNKATQEQLNERNKLQELIASFAVSFKSSNRAIDEALYVYDTMKGELE